MKINPNDAIAPLHRQHGVVGDDFGRPVKFDPDADALSRDSARARNIAATGSIGAKCRVGS
jgi:hypothetical protein